MTQDPVNNESLYRINSRPYLSGAVAQLVEHLLCKQGVVGSTPISSTIYQDCPQILP